MGEDAKDTLTSTNIMTKDRKKYDAVLRKFDEFFGVRRNIIFERARINRRNQLPDDSAEQFITSLYSLADGCEYGNLKDEVVRDHIIVGIRDKAFSEWMQLDALESAKTIVRLSSAR